MQTEEILEDLNQEQKQAVTYDGGPFLIIAGAGTGKTTVITRRIGWLILSGKAKPEEILAVTFTDKAAEEMEERIDKLLPYGYFDFWISTFHSFCEKILRNHALDIGLPLNFKLLNQTQQILLVRQNFERFNLDYYRPLGNPFRFIQDLVKHFSRAKDELVSPEDYFEYAEKKKLDKDSALSSELLDEETKRLEEIAGAYQTYQQLLLENSALDFGDLINYTIKLFKERPNILERYRQQFKYILVDEFQDTNWAQYELLKLLAAPKNNLAVISDDDQAIYRWRGASYNNVIQFKKDFPKSLVITLVKNYRSRQNILDLAYKFIQLNNPNRLEAQVCEVGKLDSGLNKQICKKLEAERPGQGIIEYIEASTQEEETEKVADKIISLKKENPENSWNDFAILVRANNQAENFCQTLRWRSIPYQFLAHSGLFSKAIILDILAYLKLLDNYHESPALYRILTSPIFTTKLKNEDLVNLVYWANRKGQSLYQTLKNVNSIPNFSSQSIAEINRLLGWLEKHSQMARSQSVGKIVFAFLNDSGYLKILTQWTKNNGFSAEEGSASSGENWENISWLNQFFKKIEEFENSNTDKSVKNFIETIDMIIESGDEGSLQVDLEEGPEAVKIMTVHGAKGLEFKYVFVVNLVDRRFPTAERKEGIELPDDLMKEIIPKGDIHLQEERRLFYVAMTRAKDGLFFTSAKDYGGTRKKKPSRFLYELGLVKKEKISDSQPVRTLKLPIFTREELPRKSEIKLPTKFSFSQIKAFETCPLQYKFTFILKIPVKGRYTFSFGQTMHNTLYNFMQRFLDKKSASQDQLFSQPQLDAEISDNLASNQGKSVLPPLDELLKIYHQCWIDDWYPDEKYQDRYKKLGEKSLKKFYQEIQKNPPNPKYLELDFNFKLDNFTIRGKMDRVDNIEGGLEIIDYKTGQSKGKDLSLEDKEQLLIYQMAGQNLFREKIVKLTYYYLDDNSKVSFLGTDEEIEKMRQKVRQVIKNIQKSNFPPNPGWLCKYCDFRGICEYRKI